MSVENDLTLLLTDFQRALIRQHALGIIRGMIAARDPRLLVDARAEVEKMLATIREEKNGKETTKES